MINVSFWHCLRFASRFVPIKRYKTSFYQVSFLSLSRQVLCTGKLNVTHRYKRYLANGTFWVQQMPLFLPDQPGYFCPPNDTAYVRIQGTVIRDSLQEAIVYLSMLRTTSFSREGEM